MKSATKLSIITAVHNALPMNQLFYDCLKKNTQTPFELVLIDNHSTDGSEVFFYELSRHQKIVYLRNDTNVGYPASQNQGMKAATGDVLVFLNNDVWLPKGWELPLLAAVEKDPMLVVSPSGQEAQPSQQASNHLKNRWKHCLFLSRWWARIGFRSEGARLEKALQWMYGDLEDFKNPTAVLKEGYFNGIKGDAIMMTRAFVDAFPFRWDERVEAADWHLYLSIAKKHAESNQFPLPQVITESYAHHFGRYSARLGYEPIRPAPHYVPLESLWSSADIAQLWWGNFLPQR